MTDSNGLLVGRCTMVTGIVIVGNKVYHSYPLLHGCFSNCKDTALLPLVGKELLKTRHRLPRTVWAGVAALLRCSDVSSPGQEVIATAVENTIVDFCLDQTW
ncbi:hypothetical protein ES703_47472 [subsurface metagenome]